VVRAVLPELGIIVLTHADIPGFMPGMTMGFRMTVPKIPEALSVGDEVRFTLRGSPPLVVLTAIEKTP
jgi:Cu/Ag efflux protein CusF